MHTWCTPGRVKYGSRALSRSAIQSRANNFLIVLHFCAGNLCVCVYIYITLLYLDTDTTHTVYIYYCVSPCMDVRVCTNIPRDTFELVTWFILTHTCVGCSCSLFIWSCVCLYVCVTVCMCICVTCIYITHLHIDIYTTIDTSTLMSGLSYSLFVWMCVRLYMCVTVLLRQRVCAYIYITNQYINTEAPWTQYTHTKICTQRDTCVRVP